MSSHLHWRFGFCGFRVPHVVVVLLLLLLMLLLLMLMEYWCIKILTDVLMFLQLRYSSFCCVQIELILLNKTLLCCIYLHQICSILFETMHLTVYFRKMFSQSCHRRLQLLSLLFLHLSRKRLVSCLLLLLPSHRVICVVYQQLIEFQHIRCRRQEVWRRGRHFFLEDHFRRRRRNDGRWRMLRMRK